MNYGQFPQGPVIFAACDHKYFLEHEPALVYSCDKVGKDVHIHVVNMTEECRKLAITMDARTKVNFTMTWEDKDFSNMPAPAERAFYASLRFLRAPMILEYARRMLIVDVDCMIMNDFEFPNKPLGYFPREPLPGTVGWEQEGTKVAAGAVYYDVDAWSIANEVKEVLEELPLQWFNDQIALNTVFSKVPDDMVEKFDGQFMDWKFVEGTTIWTGKGPRKYDNPIYVAKKKEYTECLLS